MRCKATTQSGDRCKNAAVQGSAYCYVKSHGEGKEPTSLSEKRERFCQLYVSEEFFGNGTNAYIEAYNKNPGSPKEINACASAASRLLRNVKICGRINELLDDAGLNDRFVDKQLLMMITQHGDLTNKMAAIREYNKLKARITNNIDVKSGGKKITGIQFVPIDESGN